MRISDWSSDVCSSDLTLFAMALVIVVVRARLQGMDRSLIEASADLYATPWRTFRQVTLPQIFPGVLSGFLLSFTFSFDDFVVAFFVAAIGRASCRERVWRYV